jgi:predicted ribosome quality control (RQC) complex YloA/Tae2 family protein
MKRLDAIREDHRIRMLGLEEAETSSVLKAKLIEKSLQKVEQALFTVRSALATGMDWAELKELLREKTKRGDPTAAIIVDLDLSHNQIVVLLPELSGQEEDGKDYDRKSEGSNDSLFTDEEDDFESHQRTSRGRQEVSHEKLVRIEIDLSLSAFANARRYYDVKKQSRQKHEKTAKASGKVVPVFSSYSIRLYW